MELKDDKYCFACGKQNPIGLKMNFDFYDNKIITKFIPQREHQGWKDIIHGGILFTLMDEIMAQLIIHQGKNVVTSKMDTKFLRPAKPNDELTVIGEVKKEEDKTIQAVSKITNSQGKLIAFSKGVYTILKK